MSILYLRARPALAFDEKNPVHRKYYFEFLTKGTWGNCPVRFMAESLNTDLVTHINQKMLTYYVSQEFTATGKKRVPSTKSKKSTLGVKND
jgi:hypothetical protein